MTNVEECVEEWDAEAMRLQYAAMQGAYPWPNERLWSAPDVGRPPVEPPPLDDLEALERWLAS